MKGYCSNEERFNFKIGSKSWIYVKNLESFIIL